MIACKRIVIVEDPGRVVLSDLPFQAGQRLEVVLIAEEQAPAAAVEGLRRLLKETQSLPSSQKVSDEEIAEEVAAYRSGR